MGKPEIEAFLTYLAVQGRVAASTQNQALSALLFLYHEGLDVEVAGVDAIRAKQPQYAPTVLTRQEAITLLCLKIPTYACKLVKYNRSPME